MATQLGRMVTNLEQLLPMLLYSLVACSSEMTLQTTTYLHHHNACDHQTWQGCDLPWWVPTHKVTWPGSYPYSHMTLESRDRAKSREVIISHYHDAYDHQALQGCALLWGGTHKVTWLYNHVVLRDHITTTMPVATKRGRYMQWRASSHKFT